MAAATAAAPTIDVASLRIRNLPVVEDVVGYLWGDPSVPDDRLNPSGATARRAARAFLEWYEELVGQQRLWTREQTSQWVTRGVGRVRAVLRALDADLAQALDRLHRARDPLATTARLTKLQPGVTSATAIGAGEDQARRQVAALRELASRFIGCDRTVSEWLLSLTPLIARSELRTEVQAELESRCDTYRIAALRRD